jgi:hypothetical protein
LRDDKAIPDGLDVAGDIGGQGRAVKRRGAKTAFLQITISVISHE